MLLIAFLFHLVHCFRYYNLDAYHRHQMEKEMKRGPRKIQKTERTIFNDEEQRRYVIVLDRFATNMNNVWCHLFFTSIEHWKSRVICLQFPVRRGVWSIEETSRIFPIFVTAPLVHDAKSVKLLKKIFQARTAARTWNT